MRINSAKFPHFLTNTANSLTTEDLPVKGLTRGLPWWGPNDCTENLSVNYLPTEDLSIEDFTEDLYVDYCPMRARLLITWLPRSLPVENITNEDLSVEDLRSKNLTADCQPAGDPPPEDLLMRTCLIRTCLTRTCLTHHLCHHQSGVDWKQSAKGAPAKTPVRLLPARPPHNEFVL